MQATYPGRIVGIAEKRGAPYIKPKKISLERAKGCWGHGSWMALPKKVWLETSFRNRTIQTIKAEIWSKTTCYNLIWTIRVSYGFEPPPRSTKDKYARKKNDKPKRMKLK